MALVQQPQSICHVFIVEKLNIYRIENEEPDSDVGKNKTCRVVDKAGKE